MNEELKDKTAKDNERRLVLLRAQKLSSALYLVTNFLSDREPIKWRLRKMVLWLDYEMGQSNTPRSVSLIDQTVSLIDIVLNGQLGSEMNFSILKKEFSGLKDQLARRQAIQLLDQTGPRRSSGPAPAVPQSLGPGKAPKVESRRGLILDFIGSRAGSSIRDIAQAAPNVSPKTIQRELAALVGAGAIEREGDRRWSRYRLALKK